MEQRPILVIGSGPAGTATALHLERLCPTLARDTLLLDKAEHPRDKVCAGGLIPHTLDVLRELDVSLSVPHVIVDNAAIRVPGSDVAFRGSDLCHVVRRAEFDASLAAACRERGIEVRGGERVIDVVREAGKVRVETERGSYRADAVVGADGSGSLVRRKLLRAGNAHTGRAIMTDIPAAKATWDGHGARRYDFYFSAVAERLRGYLWAFPCLIAGEPHINLGAYSVEPEGAYLYELLHREAERLGAVVERVQAFPIHWYTANAPLAADGALLVGDAAGVDPLMGEGISFCFEYGRLAAAALAPRTRLEFAAYQAAVRRSWFGAKLRRLRIATTLFYGPTSHLWFGLAARSRRAQELGVRWYNGVGRVDRMSLWQGLRALRALGKEMQAISCRSDAKHGSVGS